MGWGVDLRLAFAVVASPCSPRDGTQGWGKAMEVVAAIAVVA